MLSPTTPSQIYWWIASGLFVAQRGGIDPSVEYTSTDLADALEQAGYRPDIDIVHPNEAPDLETEVWF